MEGRPLQHIYLKQVLAEFARKDRRVHYVYYLRVDRAAYFAIDFSNGDKQMVQNIYTIMNGISENEFHIYRTNTRTGKRIAEQGEMIYDETIDQRRGKRGKNNSDEDDDEEDFYDDEDPDEEDD